MWGLLRCEHPGNTGAGAAKLQVSGCSLKNPASIDGSEFAALLVLYRLSYT